MALAGEPEELLQQAWLNLDQGKLVECMAAARKAADLFTKKGDSSHEADAGRALVLCLCNDGKRKEAATLAEEKWAHFRQNGARLAEGKMLLALSEANAHKRGPKKRQEAQRTAKEALHIFRDLRDKRMEGVTLLVLVKIYLKGLSSENRLKNLNDASEHAQEALSIFKVVEDHRLQAEAMHALAAARVQAGSLEAGLRSAKDALATYQELGMKTHVVFENQCIAEWLLGAGMLKQAQPYAEEALNLSQQFACGSTWEASTHGTAVRALIPKRTDTEKALQLARKGVDKAQKDKDKMAEALMQDTLITALLHQGNVAEARDIAEGALKLVKELGHSEHEAALLRALAQMALKLQEPQKALEAAEAAMKLSQKLGDGARQAALSSVIQAHKAGQSSTAALEAVLDEREAFKRADRKRGEAVTLLMAAGLHAAGGDRQKALSEAVQASQLFREAGDRPGQAAAMQTVAQVDMAEGLYDAALRAAQECLTLVRETGDLPGEARIQCLIAQASILITLGDAADPSTFKFGQSVDKAARFAQQALLTSRRSGSSELVGATLSVQAQALLASSKGQEAVQAASSAVAAFRGIGDPHGEAYALLMNACGLVATGKSQKGREAATKALQLFSEVPDQRGMELALEAMDTIDNPPEPEDAEMYEAYGEVQLHYRSSAGAMVRASQETAVQAALKRTVRETVGDIVGFDDIQDDTPLMQTGLTSQSAVLLRNALTKELPGPSLPFTMMFDYPSVNHLTEFFVRRGQN